jgi:hypothetical protein
MLSRNAEIVNSSKKVIDLAAVKRFLGEFSKLRKALISFVMSVRLSVCPSAWNNSVPTGRIFIKFGVLSIFRKSVEKIQVLLKHDKNDGHSTWMLIYIYGRMSPSSS